MNGRKRSWLACLALVAAGCGPSNGDNGTPDPDPGDVFGQDSPRPECQYTVETSRVPYAMPQVVASGWSAPVKLPTLNTPCPEDAIEISRDGSTLYFYWSPTVGAPPSELLHGTTGTYRAQRAGLDPGAFTDPRFFDLRQETDGACDGEPSFTPPGDFVFFHSTRASNTGYQKQPPENDPMDIYVAPISGGVPGPVQNLGEPVNSPYLDGEHALSPDGTKLYLTSTRPGGMGKTDLWLSTRTGSTWGAPVNLGAPINTTGAELQPSFSASDPATMYFASDRQGATGIFRSTHDGTSWSTPEIVITGYVGEPSLVADGSILYFVHVLVDAAGVFGADIWYIQKQS